VRLRRIAFALRARRAGLFLALSALPLAMAFAQVADRPPADLAEARSRLAAAKSAAEFAALLDSLSASLPPSDALALLGQGLPPGTGASAAAGFGAALAPETRRPLVLRAGDLSLLLGLFAEASQRYAEAAALFPSGSPEGGALIVRAARSALAAGDAEAALALSSALGSRSGDPALAAAGRLVEAWAAALQGRLEEARSLAASVIAPPDRAREACFILWLCAATADRESAAAALAARFPGSPEALMASGAASPPPLPHWYLGGFGRAVPAAKPAAAPAARPAAVAEAKASPAAGQAPPVPRGRRLQVGYFSVEDNARALRDELVAKGFAASVEPRPRAAGSAKNGEARWIVAVPEGKDIAATIQSLKDSGYESYIIE
jgi:hypothetical protein